MSTQTYCSIGCVTGFIVIIFMICTFNPTISSTFHCDKSNGSIYLCIKVGNAVSEYHPYAIRIKTSFDGYGEWAAAISHARLGRYVLRERLQCERGETRRVAKSKDPTRCVATRLHCPACTRFSRYFRIIKISGNMDT